MSATNIPTEYELTYTVTFSVMGANKELLAPQTPGFVQGLQLRRNALLAKGTGPTNLRQQMARDLVTIAMRRLTSLK